MEKAAEWERLHEDKLWEKLNCIIMSSQGQATRGVRRLLQRLNKEHKLPIMMFEEPEKPLSEKRRNSPYDIKEGFYLEKDVAQAVKRLKESSLNSFVDCMGNHCITLDLKEIDKIFGEF